MRRALLSSLSALCLLLPATAMARDATGVRIETNPVYGATITVEEGVRVFRPLPPIRHLIINPEGKTPLNINIDERTVVTHHYYGATVETDGNGAGAYAGAFLPGFYNGSRHHRHRANHRKRSGYLVHAPRGPRGRK